jgi:WD40 repeat protein
MYTQNIAIDPIRRRFVTQEVQAGIAVRDQVYELLVRDAANGTITDRVPIPGRTVNRLLFSPDGAWLVAMGGPSLIVWDAADLSKKPRKTKAAGSKHITGVAFHPSGKYLAAASNDETVKLYDTATWGVARTFSWDVGRLRSVAFSPDGTRAAVGSDTHQVVVFDVDV